MGTCLTTHGLGEEIACDFDDDAFWKSPPLPCMPCFSCYVFVLGLKGDPSYHPFSFVYVPHYSMAMFYEVHLFYRRENQN